MIKEKKGEVEITAAYSQTVNIGNFENVKPMVAVKKILNKKDMPVEVIEFHQRELLDTCERVIKNKVRQIAKLK